MTHFRQFHSAFDAFEEHDRIAAQGKVVAATLFFVRSNGSIGGGPFFVWASAEGEVARIIKGMAPIKGLSKEQMPDRILERRYFATWKAAMNVGKASYEHRAHAEELLVKDFPVCLDIAGAGSIRKAVINISKSPCVGGYDRASNNLGVIQGCYNKLIFLAAKHKHMEFDVSFAALFQPYEGRGKDAEDDMNRMRLSPNITFSYTPPG